MPQGLSLTRPNWAALSILIASVLLLPFAWLGLASEWFSGEQDNAHALPAALAAIYILLSSDLTYSRSSAIWRFLISAAILVSVTAAVITQIVNIEQVSYVLVVLTTLLLFARQLDGQTLHTHLLVVLLLGLSIPIWDALLSPLVTVASVVVTAIVGWFDMTVLIEGNSITTPYGRILIAEGCSGIRYFMVALVLGAILAHMNHYRLVGTILTIGIFAFIGLLANWLRILLLVVIGYQSQMQSALMEDHEVFGWVIYALFILPAIYFAPKFRASVRRQNVSKPDRRFWVTIVLLALIANGILAFYGNLYRTDAADRADAVPPMWQQAELPRTMTTLPIQTQQPMTWHALDNRRVYIGYFSHRKASRNDKLVPYVAQSLVSNRWFAERSAQTTFRAQPMTAQVLKSQLSDQRYVRQQLFKVGDSWTDDYAVAKLQQIPVLLSGTNSFDYFLLLARCTSPDCASAVSAVNGAMSTLEGAQ